MKCPRCEEGNVIKVTFKYSGEPASLCDQCGALWFLGEGLNPNRAHNFRAFSKDLDLEHSLELSDDVDQDHSTINYGSHK